MTEEEGQDCAAWIGALENLKDNWNRLGAIAPNQDAVFNARCWLRQNREFVPMPLVMPGSTGSIWMEWDIECPEYPPYVLQPQIEISFCNDGSAIIFSQVEGKDEELPLWGNSGQRIFARLKDHHQAGRAKARKIHETFDGLQGQKIPEDWAC